MKKTSKTAFSLTEISIILIVIGILVAGVVKGRTMMIRSRLVSAMSMTENSVVRNFGELALWLETVSPESFDTKEAVKNGKISVWKNLNSSTVVIRNATQVDDYKKPTYIEAASNGMPALRFDGSDDFMNLSDETLPYGGSSYHIFVVANYQGPGAIIGSGTAGINSLALSNSLYYGNNGVVTNYWANDNWDVANVPSNQVSLISIDYDKDSATRKFYINKNLSPEGPYTSNIRNGGLTCCNYIGRMDEALGDQMMQTLNGDLFEIIVFSRSLSDKERQEIEGYLKKKWKI